MSRNQAKNCMHGIAAEFADAESILEAARATRQAGCKEIKAYTPFYVHGLNDIIDDRPNFLPWLVVIGLFVGAAFGMAFQYYASVVGYDINVGGRPFFSWPAFVPVSFELAILFAALAGVGGYFIRIGLPLPYHPIFNTPNIELASKNRFFLCVETRDKKFHLRETRTFLESLDPLNVSEVQC